MGEGSQDGRLNEPQFSFIVQLAEAIPHLVWTARPDGSVDYLNQRWCQYTGKSLEESEGWGWQSVVHPDDLEACLFEWQTARESGAPYEIEYRLMGQDKQYRWHLGRGCPVKDDDERILKWFGTCTDIHEQKQVQIMLQSVMDNIYQSIFWKDMNSVYLGCNRLFARQVGIDHPADIVGKTDYDLAPPKEQADFYRACDRRVMDNDVAEHHIIERQLQADGKEAWLDTSKVPLHDSNGKVVGILGMYEDVTERENLRQQRDDFIAALAHDLKVPIVGAIRALDLILQGATGPLSPQQENLLKTLLSSHENLMEMVRNLLDVLKLEANATEFSFSWLDLSMLLDECIDESKINLTSKKLSVHVSHPRKMPVYGDKIALRRVVQNLIGNVLQFGHPGTVVTFNLGEFDSDHVKLEVNHRGDPLPTADVNKVFQRYWHGKKFGGTVGLGLYLCRQIIEGHGGKVSCTSTTDNGTTIHLILPKEAQT